MGSGKRKYKLRQNKGFSLGELPKSEKKLINEADLKSLVALWEESKKKNKKSS